MRYSQGVILLLLCWVGQVGATNTLCTFATTDENDSSGYAFEFLGPAEIYMIEVDIPEASRLSGYEIIDFNYRKSRINMVHVSSGEPGVLPSFILKGEKKDVVMTVAGKQLRGEMSCGW